MKRGYVRLSKVEAKGRRLSQLATWEFQLTGGVLYKVARLIAYAMCYS